MRAIAFVAVLLCLPAHAADKDKIIGTWKLVSVMYEDAQTKEKTPLGQWSATRPTFDSMAELAASMKCDQGDFAEYAGLRRALTEREGDLSRFRASSRRAEAA